MRLLFRTCVALLIALPLLAIAAIAMCLQDRPLVTANAQLTPHDMERARRVVNAQDPRRAGLDGLQTITIDEQDLVLALDYLAHRFGHAPRASRCGPAQPRCRRASSCRTTPLDAT